MSTQANCDRQRAPGRAGGGTRAGTREHPRAPDGALRDAPRPAASARRDRRHGRRQLLVLLADATGVELLLFDEHDDPEPVADDHARSGAATRRSTSGTCYVRGLKPGIYYAYRVDGPCDPHGAATGSTPTRC